MKTLTPTGNATKDTLNLQRALAQGAGQQILLKAGSYSITNTLVLQNFSRLTGEIMGCPRHVLEAPDYGVVVRAAPGFRGPLFQSLSVEAGGYWDRSCVEEIALDGGDWADIGLRLSYPGERAIVQRCSFSRFQQAGVHCMGTAAKLLLEECFFSYTRGSFVTVTPCKNGFSSGLVILRGCTGDDPGGSFVRLNCNCFLEIHDCKAEQPHSTVGIASYDDTLIEFTNEVLCGMTARSQVSPRVVMIGGSIQWPSTGTILKIADGFQVRFHMDGTEFPGRAQWLIQDNWAHRQVPFDSDGGNYTYLP